MSDQLVPIATFAAYDQDELDRLAHSGGYMAILFKIEEHLRSTMKNDDMPDKVYEFAANMIHAIYDWRAEYHLPE